MKNQDSELVGGLTLVAGPYVTSLRLPTELVPVVRSTLQDLLREDDRVPSSSARVDPEPDGTFRISADDRDYRSSIDPALVPDALVRMLLLAELDAHPERLHLHAGAVALENRGVLVAGFSGHGKSTLVTALVRGGFDYLTDERVAVAPNSLTVSGFPKPISLVGGSFEVYPDLDPVLLGEGQATDTVWQIPASVVGDGGLLTEMRADLLIFVKYEEGSDVGIEPVHPVTAVGRLLHDSPDVARFGAEALRVCGMLCASARCIELTYSRPADAAPAVRALLSEEKGDLLTSIVEVFETADVEVATNVGSVAVADRLGRASGCPTLVIDGRALVHVESDQELVELDESVTAWLMLIDGKSSVDELIEAVRVETQIDREVLERGALRALGDLAARGFVSQRN